MLSNCYYYYYDLLLLCDEECGSEKQEFGNFLENRHRRKDRDRRRILRTTFMNIFFEVKKTLRRNKTN